MARHLRLTVLTPERVLLEVPNATKVRLRLADGGWLSIYPGHAPLIAETVVGPLQYETEEETGEVLLDAGVLQVTGAHQVVVLATSLESGQEAEIVEEGDQFSCGRLAVHLLNSLQASLDRGGSDASDW